MTRVLKSKFLVRRPVNSVVIWLGSFGQNVMLTSARSGGLTSLDVAGGLLKSCR